MALESRSECLRGLVQRRAASQLTIQNELREDRAKHSLQKALARSGWLTASMVFCPAWRVQHKMGLDQENKEEL